MDEKRSPRLLVGTLHSEEAEFDECVSAIHRQTYRFFDHFVISGRPKRQAHDELYGRFMQEADRYELFIKVDADMVIENCDLFRGIVDKFQEAPTMEMLTIEVYDFFSERQIDGLHIFRNSVKWPIRDSDVFTDSHIVPLVGRQYDSEELAPAAIHCKSPSAFQSFHYGLHRATKILAKLELPPQQRGNLAFHLENRELTWRHFVRTRDIRVGFASLGCELTLCGVFGTEHVAYSERYARDVFRTKYQTLDCNQVKREASRLRWLNQILTLRSPHTKHFFRIIRNAVHKHLCAKASVDHMQR